MHSNLAILTMNSSFVWTSQHVLAVEKLYALVLYVQDFGTPLFFYLDARLTVVLATSLVLYLSCYWQTVHMLFRIPIIWSNMHAQF